MNSSEYGIIKCMFICVHFVPSRSEYDRLERQVREAQDSANYALKQRHVAQREHKTVGVEQSFVLQSWRLTMLPFVMTTD